MSFLLGKTQARPTVNKQTSGLHNQLIGQVGSHLDALYPGTQIDQSSIQPFLDLYTQQNARNLAQAKETAGNLTGSGLGNIIGAEAARGNVEQMANLTQFLENRRQNDANRAASLAMGTLNSGAGGVNYTYTPGILDYLAQGATGLAAGGAFNKFFGRK